MSLDNLKVVRFDNKFRNRKGMPHHLLVHMRQETKIIIMVRICKCKARPAHSQGSVAQGDSWTHASGLGNWKVVRFDHKLRNRKGMPHHLLVHMRQETEIIISVWICNYKARLAQYQGSVAKSGSWTHACGRYGRNNIGRCPDSLSCFFKCGQEGDYMKDCPKIKQVGWNSGNRDQSSSVAPPNRVVRRVDTYGTDGGENCLYAITTCEEQGNSHMMSRV